MDLKVVRPFASDLLTQYHIPQRIRVILVNLRGFQFITYALVRGRDIFYEGEVAIPTDQRIEIEVNLPGGYLEGWHLRIAGSLNSNSREIQEYAQRAWDLNNGTEIYLS